jgi:hypothetical protein
MRLKNLRQEVPKHKINHKAQIMKRFTHPFSAAASSVKKEKALETDIAIVGSLILFQGNLVQYISTN